MNKIATVSMIKNEIDIVESFIRHTCKFADKMYICDHKSTDRTREIIEALAKELPIEVSTYDKDEKNQVGVTNNLIQHAFEENFDIVLPLDADEFVIKKDGDSKDLRKHLQNLDPSKCYKVYFWNHFFADDDIEKFALSRSIVKSKTISTTTKIILGREIFLKNHWRVVQGNHDIKLPNGAEILLADKNSPLIPHEEKIFYAHFSIRSEAQQIQKYMMSWLNTQLAATRYTPWNAHGKKFVNDYLKDESTAKIDLTGFFPADLELYKDECNLDKNGGGYENKSSSKCFHARRKFFAFVELRKNFIKA